jgi:hypothetical protein
MPALFFSDAEDRCVIHLKEVMLLHSWKTMRLIFNINDSPAPRTFSDCGFAAIQQGIRIGCAWLANPMVRPIKKTEDRNRFICASGGNPVLNAHFWGCRAGTESEAQEEHDYTINCDAIASR